MKVSPVTGEEVPDETATVGVCRYRNPRRAEWPAADFIIGNPPFLGKLYLLNRLGEGYTAALRAAYKGEVPDGCDLVMYWWYTASRLVALRKVRRFGLISTNSIRQAMNRRVVRQALEDKDPVHLVFAIRDHPWVDSSDGADVRIAMTVCAAGVGVGVLGALVSERILSSGESEVVLAFRSGAIHPDLTIGVNATAVVSLLANSAVAGTGLILGHRGFLLERGERDQVLEEEPSSASLISPLMHGNDVMETRRGVFVIDATEWSEKRLLSEAPFVYQRLRDRVLPGRQQNRDPRLRAEWWRFRRSNEQIRAAIEGLSRYIATPETSRHRVFVFLPSDVKPEHKLFVVGTVDAAILGVLSSRLHVVWAIRGSGNLGVGNDPVYSKTYCFDPFPFPACSQEQKQRIRDLGESLDAHRKRQQALHPKLTITGMYNVLEKLRSGEPLTEKEREIHEQGLVSVLKQIHDDLDAAVFEAYGWPSTLSDEEILERLVALNHERAEEEKRGLVRWLRPEFQDPEGVKAASQVSLVEAGLEAPEPVQAAKGKKATKHPWPKDLPARVVAVRDLLAELGETTAEDVPRRFRGVQTEQAEKLLESLAAVGVAIETTAGEGSGRSWSLVR